MKIAISATGRTLDALLDPRFGRCHYLLFVEPDTMSLEAVRNPGLMASGGAGVTTAQAVAGKGVEVVLTGNCGTNAYQVLSAAGIKVVTGVSGAVGDAVQDYKAGKLRASPAANVAEHFGMAPGRGRGRDAG